MYLETTKEVFTRTAYEKEAFIKKRRSQAIKIVNHLAIKENKNISFKN